MLGADATILDWIRVEQVCRLWKQWSMTWLAEWLKAREAGSRFWVCDGTEEQTAFVVGHVQGT